MKENTRYLFYLLLSVMIYMIIVYVPVIGLITLPIRLLCTFLHEFGHAFFAIITGGSVKSLAVNMDGSGVTGVVGGNKALLIMGGYIGSALFGNLILRLAGSRNPDIVQKVLAGLMFISALIWFDNFITTGILLAFSAALWYSANKKRSSYILGFLGVACVLYIIQDFNVGPSSDLQAYENEVGFFPARVWMYIWLLIVIATTALNLRALYNKRRS